MNPIYKTTEEHPDNHNACVVVVYFEYVPTIADMRELNLDLDYDDIPVFEVKPTPVSDRAGLVRVAVYNASV